ncbi:MAG: VCBS repeat-containing protein [Pirellulaceae bacterium]|nr:VCBS repeat-containing protein [Pirellulaceae bacterium]
MSDRLNRWKRLISAHSERRYRRRVHQLEQLERRDLLAAAMWHNPVFPLDVTGDQPARVSAQDALRIVNWLNNPSLPRDLPRQVEAPSSGPYVDTNCDGRVSANDALRVVNHLNFAGSGVVGGFFTDGGSFAGAACSPQLLEGSGFVTELDRILNVPANRPALEVKFQAPEFDTQARQQIRDAFEIQIVQANGNPVSNRLSSSRSAAFNWTEGYQPVAASGVWMDIAAAGQDSKVIFDLSEFPVGTEIRVLARLVNNDSDDSTSVIIRGYEFVELPTSLPPGSGEGLSESRQTPVSAFDFRQLSDLTGMFEVDYGRTSLSTDRLQLVSQAQLTNRGNTAVLGPIIAVFENFSDPNVFMVRPDGFLPDGRPFIDLTGRLDGPVLASGQSLAGPEIRFRNDSGQRFEYRLSVYGRLHTGPVGFSSQPVTSIEAGRNYRYHAQATSTIDSPLSYSLIAGPDQMTIDPQSGQVQWQTEIADTGAHQIVMRATDQYGLYVEQRFDLRVVEQLPNRPPIFTSEPEIDTFISSPFEVHTYATGQGPAAATLLSGSSGLKTIVTANRIENQLGLLPSSPILLGANQPISLGELPPAELRSIFEGPTAIDLGLVPNTTGQHERDVQQVLAEDINGDGLPDVLALVNLRGNGNWNDPNDRGFVVVRFGNGDGSFRDGWQVELPAVAGRIGRGASIHFADVTSDGLKDIVVTTIATNRILVYANTGSGSFDTNPTTSTVEGNYVALAQMADIDRDDNLDLVLFENVQVQISGRQAISIYRGDGTGRFSESFVITEDTNNGGQGYIADLDGANGPDIVRLNYNNLRIESYLNDGTGSFGTRIDSATKSFHSSGNPSGVFFNATSGYFDDFDSDGKVDALISGPFGATLMRGQGDGRFGDGTSSGSVTLLPYTVEWYGLGNQTGRGLELNGDAHLDFVFGNTNNENSLLIGLGRGDGTFALTQYSTAFDSDIGTGTFRNSQSTIFAAAADFNRDGVMDILLGNALVGEQAGSVGLLLGDRPGTLRAPQSLRNFDFDQSFSPTTFGMRESVTGDFNNDGVLDIVTYGGIGFGGGFYFASGLGDGTFEAYSTVFGGVNSAHSLTVLDIDLDGNLDLAWIDGTQFRQAFGLGNGAFQALPSVVAPGGQSGVSNRVLQVDDFNGDGYPDLVYRLQTGNIDTNHTTRLAVLLYDPVNRRYNILPDSNDTITNWPRAHGFYFDESVGIGDLNGNGKQEIFFFSRSIPSSGIPARWVILEQTGGPATDASTLFRKTVIENPAFIPHDRSIYSYVIDDFDGDGINDIAYSGNHVQTTVMFGNGDFTFRDTTNYYTHTFQLDRGDFNGDGVTDLVAMWGWGFLSQSSRPYQSILFGRGDGTFSELHGFTAVANLNGSVIGDFNGDGRDDLAGTAEGTQGVAFISQPRGVSDVVSGDLNGDGKADLVSIISGLNRVKLHYQVTDEVFARQPDLLTDLYPVAVDLLDVDQNGLLDILTANQQGKSVSIFRQSASGNFNREDIELPVRPSDLRIADLNGDGIQDLIVLSKSEETIMVLIGSAGTFSPSLVLPLGFAPGDLTLGDVTEDGALDIALTDPNGERVIILPGHGNGTFGTAISVLGITSPGALAIADMNRDGRNDLVVAQPDAGRVGFLYQRGAGKFTAPQWIEVGVHPIRLVADDVNGDGAPDVLVVNQGDDTVSLILNRFDPSRLWTYQPAAIDPDDDPVSFELIDAPGGMLHDLVTNTIYWAPMPEQLGGNSVVVEASDGRGGVTQQGFRIIVTAPVSQSVPRFTSTPITEVAADSVYRYQPNVVLQNQSALRYSLAEAPQGMTIHPTTGEIDWDPRTSSLKLHTGSQNYGYIEAPDAPSLRPASVSVEGWYYFEDPNGAVWENLLAKRASTTNPNVLSFGLEYYYGTLRARVGSPDNANSLAIVTAPTPVQFQKWTHVAMTFDDTSKALTLWINGVNVGTAVSPEGISYNASPLQSGKNIATLARQRIWNRALTAAEITQGMLADVPSDATGLVLQWNFNESRDVTTILDSSPARNHGTLTGTPDWRNYPTRQKALASEATHEVIVRVEDGRGGVAEQSFHVDIVPPFLKQVSGIVFLDVNGDGVQDLPSDFNRIANPDFSSGPAGWETNFYQRTPQSGSGWLGDAQVTVGLSSRVIPTTSDYFGHTNGSNQDLMLIVNGDHQDRVAWRQLVTLIPGQDYDFSFWALRPNNHEAARMEVHWNGQPLGSAFTLEDISAGAWKQFRHSLHAATEQGILEIISVGSTLPPNPNNSSAENSFAIDDLMLVPSTAQRLIVPGYANPYLAGMANGSTAYGSTAPQGSPPSLAIQPGQVLRIRATGHTLSDGFVGTRSPDGIVYNATGTVSNALHGISQYAGPNHGSLLGVFLNDESPSGQTTPASLDFRSTGNVTGGINYTSIAPELRQLFFIGDGFTSDGIEQTIVVPQGATRLFLANSSTNSWSGNTGSFEVQVFTNSGEPIQAGRTVFLDTNRNSFYDTGEPTAITDAQGRYRLTTTGKMAHVGLVGVAGQLQSAPQTGVQPLNLNSVTPAVNFGSRAAPADPTPVFLSQPTQQATAPGSYIYQAFAQSPLAVPVYYELIAAPEGMTIDRVSGLVQWLPLASQSGVHDILIKVSDPERRFAIQRFPLNVVINTAPNITSNVPLDSQVGLAWRYQVRAQDAEQEEFTYRLISFPAGMTITTDSGIIDFVLSVVGSFTFEVEVDDGFGGVSRQQGSVTVTPVASNQLPQWIAGLKPTAIVQRPYASQLVAVDNDHEPLTFSLVSGPVGLTVSASGQVQWQPAELGSVNVTLSVEDSRGGRAERTESIAVVSRAPMPTLSIDSLPETAARVGILYEYDVIAPEAVLFELVDAPVGMSIDPQYGFIRWMPTRDSLGVQEVVVRGFDLFGHVVTQSFRIAVRSSSLVPTISSAPPTEAVVGSTYLYSVRTSNPSASPLQHELVLAPVGMLIDTQSGEIAWTPTAEQVGLAAVSIRVSDGLGNFSTQTFSIAVAAGVSNRAPSVNSTAPADAVVGQPYVYMLQGTDPEGDDLTYGLRIAPAGMVIDAVSGVITWTPQSAEIGTVGIVLTASDPQGAVAVQSFQVDVRAANRAPEIRSNPTLSISQGELYRYDVLAIDPDREPLTYELVQGPEGMTIDALGRIRWQTQLNTPLGGREVVVRVRDGLGASATQSYTFGVVPDTLAPRLTIIVTGEPVLFPWTVHPAIVRVIATDNVGVTNLELRVDGQSVELAPDGTARVYFSAPGNGRLIATATDAAGNVGTATGRVLMRSGEEDGSGNPAPEAAITSIGQGAAVSGFVDVIGTAISPDFERYTLSYRRIDQTQYSLIHEGTTQVSAAALGKWDTTLLENDNYVLKLEVMDTFGSFAAVEVEVSVTGNLKLGNFRLSFEDLTIPVAGIPITIARSYDTLRADRDGDFGYGWRLEYRNTDLRVSLPKSGLEDLGIFTPFRSGTKIFMTLPGGERVSWTFTPEFKVLPGWAKGNDLVMASPRYTPDRGNTATLSAGSGWLTVNQFGELYATGGMPWNPASPDFGGGFTVTTADGTRYFIDGSTGLMETAADRSGNRLTFSDNGITSSQGDVGITIARDRHGRITSITDPAGNAIRYGYSASGDLIRVTDREDHSTTMTYRTDRPHYLDTIVDPLGRTGIRTNFSDQGRLTSLTMADGTVRQMDYDPDNHFVLVTDPLGRISVIGYDAFGNQVSHTDALGGESRLVFNDLNLPVEYRDPLGRITRYGYDSAGNITSIIDPSGGITYQTFGSFGTLETATDVFGATTRSELDSRGNPLRIRDGVGNLTTITYSISGDPSATVISGVGAIQTTIVNQRLLSITDAAGTVARHEYDGAGYMTASIVMLHTDDGVVEVRREFSHDANGRLLEVVDAVGGRTLYSYDAAGNRTSTTDPLGRITTFTYDSMNRLIRTTYPDGLTETKQYDLVGNLIQLTDRGGRSTHYQYDAVNRPTVIILPDPTPDDLADNPRRAFEYDLAGQLIAVIDEEGYRTTYSYGTASRPAEIIDPLGQTTKITYDLAERKVSHIDPSGHITRWTYDLSGNPIETIYANGELERLQFNARNDVIARTNAIGETTRYEYDPLGRITAVVDPLGNRTTHHYDSLGRLVRTVDALGRQTRFTYDLEDRILSKTLPDGSTRTYEYDLAGQLIREVDFAGQASTYLYDVLGRVVESRRSDEVLEYSYTSTGRIVQVRDNRGVTKYDYDELDRVLKRTDPDGLFVDYTYDQRGNIVSIRTASSLTQYVYDALSRPVVVTDSAGLETEFAYDASSNLVQTRYWNGLVEQRQHDARGRVLQIDLESPTELLSRYTYQIDAAGRRTSLTELDGSQSSYQYDASGRLIRETHTASAGGQRTIQYEYDAVGNRLATFDTASGTTLYSYDSRDQLITLTDATGQTNRIFDANGNLISIVPDNGDRQDFVWDSAGRLIRVTQGAQGILEAEYVYDHRGQRIQTLDARGQRRLLIDDNRPLAVVLEELHEEPTSTVRHTYASSAGARISLLIGAQPMIVHGDHLGSTRLLSNSNGQITDRISYTGFGDVLVRNGVTPLEWLYTGESRDNSSGMYFLRARHYDPATGRFISQDPFAGFQNDPLSLHRYVYAHLNPISNRDPSGENTLIEALQGIQLQSVLQYGLINGAVSGLLAAISGGSIMRGFFSGFFLGAAGGAAGQFFINSQRLLHAQKLPASYSALAEKVVELGGKLKINKKVAEDLMYAAPGFLRGLEELPHLESKIRLASIVLTLASDFGVWGLSLYWQFQNGFELDTSLPSADPIFGINPADVKDYFPNQK